MRLILILILVFLNIVFSQQKNSIQRVRENNLSECIEFALLKSPKIINVKIGKNIFENHFLHLELDSSPLLDNRKAEAALKILLFRSIKVKII